MKLFSFIVSIQPIALFLQGAYLVDGLVQYTNFEHRIKSCEESHPYYNNRDTVFCRKSHSLSRHWNISGRNRPYNPDINDVTDMNYNQPRKRGLFRTDRQFHYDDSSIQHSAIFNPLLILFQLKRLLPKSKALIQGSLIPMIPNVFTTRKKVVKSIFFFTLTVLLFNSMRDMMQTKKRQSVDPTSEWGRYADYPSIRGKALFALMGKMTFWIILVKLINILPDSIFSRRKKMNSIENNSVKNARDLHNGGSSSSACDDYSWAEEKATKIREYSGEKMAEGLLRLGPLYIKIGQIISCRDKLLPEEWKKALERLQDRVPAKSGQEAFDLAYQAYDGNSTLFHSIFSDFEDEPLAAASLGQVHRARLHSNNVTVAIKLQRSRLRDIYDKDLALMQKLAKGVDTFAGKVGQIGGVKQSWEDIFQDAEEILYREIDYRDEANNAMRFASDFGIGVDGKSAECTAKSLDGKVLPSAAKWIRTPYIYDNYSTEKILVMEYVPSIKISNNKELAANGVTVRDREFLAECLARAYLRQFCVNKFFSTDPHPGNLGVELIENDKGERKPRLVFYDFGQACYLKDDQAGGILDVIEGIIDSNVDNCVNAFIRMGVIVDGADLEKVRKKVQQNFETGLIKVKKKRSQNQNNFINEVNESNDVEILDSTLTVHNATSATDVSLGAEKNNVNDAEIMSFFTLPAEYAFVARALSQMDGVGKSLDADFDFISASAPHLVEIKGSERYLLDEVKKLVAPVLKWQVDIQKAAGFNPKR